MTDQTLSRDSFGAVPVAFVRPMQSLEALHLLSGRLHGHEIVGVEIVEPRWVVEDTHCAENVHALQKIGSIPG